MDYLISQVASMVVDRSTSDTFLSQRFGGMMPPLFVLFLIFIVHSFLLSHSYIAFIRRHSPVFLSISSSSTSLGCRAENRTRASLTTSRRTTTELCCTHWITSHPTHWVTPQPLSQHYQNIDVSDSSSLLFFDERNLPKSNMTSKTNPHNLDQTSPKSETSREDSPPSKNTPKADKNICNL